MAGPKPERRRAAPRCGTAPRSNILSKMTRGFRDRVTVWAKLAPGEPSTNLRVSIERRLAGVTNFTTVVGDTLVGATSG